MAAESTKSNHNHNQSAQADHDGQHIWYRPVPVAGSGDGMSVGAELSAIAQEGLSGGEGEMAEMLRSVVNDFENISFGDFLRLVKELKLNLALMPTPPLAELSGRNLQGLMEASVPELLAQVDSGLRSISEPMVLQTMEMHRTALLGWLDAKQPVVAFYCKWLLEATLQRFLRVIQE